MVPSRLRCRTWQNRELRQPEMVTSRSDAGFSARVPANEQDINLHRWLESLAARHRFGDDDRIGTANLIDAAARRRAAESVVHGRAVSLERPLRAAESSRRDDLPGFETRFFFTDRGSGEGIGTDHVEIDCHGHVNTHLDALNHMAKNGTWYNAWPVDSPNETSVNHLAAHGLFTRGVLLDITNVRGDPWVDVDDPVSAADLDAAVASAGITIERGDALLLHMGRDRFEAAGNAIFTSDNRWSEKRPGVGRSGAEWISEHDISIVCWDFLDAHHPSHPRTPVHFLIWAIGLLVVDNCTFSEALEAVVQAGQVTGALVVAPLRMDGGTGCSVNPLFVL